jgi:hypothetical protein
MAPFSNEIFGRFSVTLASHEWQTGLSGIGNQPYPLIDKLSFHVSRMTESRVPAIFDKSLQVIPTRSCSYGTIGKEVQFQCARVANVVWSFVDLRAEN